MNTTDQKIILISGATSGIGNATVKKLIDLGHIVYGSYRKETDQAKIEAVGGIPIQFDMTDYDSLERAVKRVITEQGRIDVLYNNAGYGLYGAVEDVTIEEAKYQFDVNLFGLARLTQLVLPHMRAQHSGTIINTSSIGGKIYSPLGAWYHATKHALEGWSDCLRIEVKQHGIDVVIIEPGMIKTEFGGRLKKNLEKRSQNSAYKELNQAMIKASESMYESNQGSEPSVIATEVAKGIKSKNPKTRYAKGKMASMLLFVRKWSSDKFFDKFVMLQINQIIKKGNK